MTTGECQDILRECGEWSPAKHESIAFSQKYIFWFLVQVRLFPSKVSLPFNLLFASSLWSQNSGALVMVDWPVRWEGNLPVISWQVNNKSLRASNLIVKVLHLFLKLSYLHEWWKLSPEIIVWQHLGHTLHSDFVLFNDYSPGKI